MHRATPATGAIFVAAVFAANGLAGRGPLLFAADPALAQAPAEASQAQIAAAAQKLTSLGLSQVKGSFHDDRFRPIPVYAPAITRTVNDAVLQELPSVPFAFGLNLGDAPIGDSALASLATQPELCWLRLTGTAVTDEGIAKLAALPRLVWLDLQSTKVTAAGLKHLHGHPSLALWLDPAQVVDPAFAQLGGHEGISWRISTEASDQVLRALANAQLLHCFFAASGKERAGIASEDAVIGFNLGNTKVTDQGIALLARLPNLTELYLRHTPITNVGARQIAAFPALANLTLDATAIDDDGLAALAKMKNLTQLSLEQTGVTDAGMKHLAQISKLSRLDLRDAHITDAGLAHLAGLAELRWLQLCGTAASGAGLAPFASRRDLAVSLDQAQVLSPAADALRAVERPAWRIFVDESDQVIRRLHELGHLFCLGCAHGAEGARPRDSSEVVHLILRGEEVTGTALDPLGEFVNLKSLWLEQTGMKDADLALLKNFPKLEQLSITDSKISDAALEHLLELEGLRTLTLKRTNVSIDGLRQLAGMKSLSELHIRGRGITPASLSDLQQSLPHCHISQD